MGGSFRYRMDAWCAGKNPSRTRATPERLRGVFTTRRYTKPRFLPFLPFFTFTLPLQPMKIVIDCNYSLTCALCRDKKWATKSCYNLTKLVVLCEIST